MTTKKALIVSPYLDHLGGGERYMLEAASAIESAGYQVFFAWDNLDQITKLTGLLGISFNSPSLDPKVLPLYFTGSPLAMYKATRPYTMVLYMSDGSIPLLGSNKNILHMQVPFHDVGGHKISNQFKLKNIRKIIVNSKFTKSFVDREYGIDSQVIYPPVSEIKEGVKEKIILSVGRFEPSLNVKQQDKLIEAFKQLVPGLPDWKLVLAGSSSDKDWEQKLVTLAKGFPIELLFNVSYPNLQKLYTKSQIYWHAAGLDVNEASHPELTEHFGITTAEAISAGCIPLVVPKGGQKEVVPIQDLYFNNSEELITLTAKVIADLSFYRDLSSDLSVNQFNTDHFRKSIIEAIQ